MKRFPEKKALIPDKTLGSNMRNAIHSVCVRITHLYISEFVHVRTQVNAEFVSPQRHCIAFKINIKFHE